MRSSQWYTFAVASFVLFWLIIGLATNYALQATFLGIEALSIKSGMFGLAGILLFGLTWVFGICGWIESHHEKKNMEDEAPKKYKEVVKLARLEHEVKELKNKLKKAGKIKT